MNDMYAQLDELQKQLMPPGQAAPTSTTLANPQLIMSAPQAAPQAAPPLQMKTRPQGQFKLPQGVFTPPQPAPQSTPAPQPQPRPRTPPNRQGILYKRGKAPNRNFSWGL